MRLVRALSELDDTLDRVESMFLGRQPFLCGDDITVADLLAVCELMQVRRSDWFTAVTAPAGVWLSCVKHAQCLHSLWRAAGTS